MTLTSLACPLCGNVSLAKEETVSIPFAAVSLWWVMGTDDLQLEKPVRSRSRPSPGAARGVAVGFTGKVCLMQSVQGGELGHEP